VPAPKEATPGGPGHAEHDAYQPVK